jgi:secreted trypsin-like serine protease
VAAVAICYTYPVLSEDAPVQSTWGIEDDTELKPKVVGGDPAERGKFPWQVYVRTFYELPDDEIGTASCGGSVVWPGWILTAAHCLYFVDDRQPDQIVVYKPSQIVVYIGDVEWKKGTPVEVKKYFPHEQYDPKTTNNDIALLQLRQQAGSDLWIGILQEADEDRLAGEGTAAIVSGWGATFDPQLLQALGYDASMYTQEMWEDFTQPARLSFTALPIRSLSYCKEIGSAISDKMICAGGLGGKGTCFGDSGGPLVVPADDSRNGYLQVGIVSRALTGNAICGQPGYPAVFTRVSQFSDWMAKIMRENR